MEIIQRLRSVAKILFAQLDLHGKLAIVEWEEEKNRLQQLFAIGVIGFAFLLCVLLFAGFVAVALSWSTDYRIVTIVATFAFYCLALCWCAFRFNTLAARGSAAFAATREEITADLALIRGQL